ncbi:MAG TPA: FHA domain-containing protein [Candidatus Polarisedimenticolaceae bacterium]|nr:FHA domain-containing protein [Candidatus Polarisedimenticolaceae bacterium]
MPTSTIDPLGARTAQHEVRRPPFGAPHVWILAVIDGERPHQTHRLIQYETVIGRGQGAHFELDDEEVSKRHCLLRVDGAVCTLQDLGSTNGTRLNGRKMRERVAHRLRHLDEIQIGTTRLLVLGATFRQPAPE